VTFAKVIFKICFQKEIKQVQIARHLGVTGFLVNHWFKGRQLPTEKQLQRILEFISANEVEKADAWEAFKKDKKERQEKRHPHPPMNEDAIDEMLSRIATKIESQYPNIINRIQRMESRIAAIGGQRLTPVPPETITTVLTKPSLSFAEFICQICFQKGIKQVQIARHLGVTSFLVNHWFKGRQLPTEKQRQRILEFISANEVERANAWEVFKKDGEKLAKKRRSTPSQIPQRERDEDAIPAMLSGLNTQIESQYLSLMNSTRELENQIAALEDQCLTAVSPQAI